MTERDQTQSSKQDRLDAVRLIVKALPDVDWQFDACDLLILAEYVRTGARPTTR